MKKIFPHIFVFLAFILLVFLGTWQVQRRAYKQDLMSKVDQRLAEPAITLQDFKSIEHDEFRKIILTGEYLNDQELLLLNKGYNGKQGQHVLTPFKVKGGKVIIVDRGWIPPDKDPVHYEGETMIKGIIRAPQKLNAVGKMVIMENDPAKKVWFWFDLAAMEKELGLAPNPFYVDLVAPKQRGPNTTYPIALPEKIQLYNEHLQYVITWYSLALVLLVVYYFRFFRK